jgi:hypothetical protein
MALLAWLFLVITPVFGAPAGMTRGMHSAAHATSATQTDHCHHTAPATADGERCATHDDCCAGHACGCGAGCASVPVLPTVRGLADADVARTHPSPHVAAVPSSAFAPPLRPPAA